MLRASRPAKAKRSRVTLLLLFGALAGLGAVVAEAAPAADRAFVASTVGRLRAQPRSGAETEARLRIGTEVEVLLRRSAWARVRTAIGQEGWIHRSLLKAEEPTLRELLTRADEASSRRGERRFIERATAFAPGDPDVIQRLIDVYRAEGKAKRAWAVDKGKIAAERRRLSWDGPLYPITGGAAWLQQPCWEGVSADSRSEALAEPGRPGRKVLRGRAFPLVNSGKVVAITPAGNRTRHLDAPVCRQSPCGGGRQAGFALRRPGGEGALVPSWLVAGFRVFGYRPEGGAFVDDSGRTRVQLDEGGAYRLAVKTLDGWEEIAAGEVPAGARPVAQASEHQRHLYLLWLGPARACCPGEGTAFLDHHRSERGLGRGAVRSTRGRTWSSGWTADAAACPAERFTSLEGEPRCERLPAGCELAPPGLPPVPGSVAPRP